jgi:hypothetical protein
VYEAIVTFPQGPTSARVAAHRVIVELSPCPSKPVEVAGSFGDAPLTPFGNCSASTNAPDGPVTTVTTVKVTSSLGDVTATFAAGVFTPVVLTPTTQDGMLCGEPYTVTLDPPPPGDAERAERIAVIEWFLDLPPGCECMGAFEVVVAPAVNPLTFVAPPGGQVSTSLTTGTLTFQLSNFGIQGSATSCEGAGACTYQTGRLGVLRTSYRSTPTCR